VRFDPLIEGDLKNSKGKLAIKSATTGLLSGPNIGPTYLTAAVSGRGAR